MSENAQENPTTAPASGQSGQNQEIAPAQNQNENSPAQPQAAPQPTRMESVMAIIKSLIVRGLIIYFITSFFRKPAAPVNNGTSVPRTAARNIFTNGTDLSMFIYLSESERHFDFQESNLFWSKEMLMYGDWYSGVNGDGSYSFEKEIPVTKHMKNNGSLYAHIYVTTFGYSANPKDKNYDKDKFCYARKMLNKFKRLKASGTKNLLTGETEKLESEGQIISHWHPNLTINLITDETFWTMGTVPMPLDAFYEFTDDGKNYKPPLYPNDFWNMAKDYKPLNETYSLNVIYQPLSLLKFQLYASQQMRQKWNFFGDVEEENDDEQDTLKETLLETNPYLLVITILVSILHSVFELLAFKNDIQFWNNRNSLEGLSVRSVFFSVFQSLIVLLYVLDNETNTLIRISCFVGLGIELWKIQKVVDIKFENGRLRFNDKSSYVQSSTRQYDELAFKYLSWVCFPLLAGYSVYALLYLEHKGWYSFVLGLFYGYLLTFGFIMMTPQLFINYKLKSVAHLPWRMLTYKFLNTFIDDMFAFVIKMPTMYRIGCFRDDIIFLIFLYQRWIYPVDKKRRNEFGYAAEADEPTPAAIENKKDQ
ncbi:putative lipid scramblase CLPTM1 [Onthophagus taurus]|uniref:putative lipid scramblase CLPTM1 n=1 Tax=Onthophagus taurus TaxID=166361 RepID=UPI0039BE565C